MFRLLALLLIAALANAAAPQRIVSLSPNTTEILYGVGAFRHVVAVSQYCKYPPESAKLPHISGWMNSNIEAIVAQRPDLVVLTKDQEPFLGERLRAFQLHYLAVPSQSLADIYEAIDEIGKATDNAAGAGRLSAEMRRKLDAVASAAKRFERPSVLLCISRTPGTLSEMYVATQGSFLIDLLEIAGGRSAMTPAFAGYGKASKEAVLSLNPDVVLDLVHTTGMRGEHSADAWNELAEMKAVRNKRVYTVEDPFASHPSQLVTNTAELFLKLLHPGAS